MSPRNIQGSVSDDVLQSSGAFFEYDVEVTYVGMVVEVLGESACCCVRKWNPRAGSELTLRETSMCL